MKYFGQPDFQHGEVPAVGVLLSNLGTPDAPTPAALRTYLREFLLDQRVIELPRFTWWLILHLFILPRRPRQSAKLYEKVWTPEGSPLLVIARRQAAAVEERLRQALGIPVHVAVGMRYGNPSIGAALRDLAARGCRRLVVLPLYPQYAAATSGSTWDAVAAELATWRWVPEVRFLQHYHDHPGYIAALAASIREAWDRDAGPGSEHGSGPGSGHGHGSPVQPGPAEKLLFSFHGIPQRYFDNGDPYFCHCQKTARLVAEELELPRDCWLVSFQSLFGKEEWIKPYTDKTVQGMARAGIRSLDVVCPGFSVDCLETLEEIDGLNREIFHHAGGESFRYIPCLNDRPDHVRLIVDLVQANLAGWAEPREALQSNAEPREGWNAEAERSEAEASRRRFERVRAKYPMPADAGFGRVGQST